MLQNQVNQPSLFSSMVAHPWVLLLGLLLMVSHIKDHHPLSFSSNTSRDLCMDRLEDHLMHINSSLPHFHLGLLLQGSHITPHSIEVWLSRFLMCSQL
jgi:hypothetical protein